MTWDKKAKEVAHVLNGSQGGGEQERNSQSLSALCIHSLLLLGGMVEGGIHIYIEPGS